MKKTSNVPLWLQITLNLLTIGIVASLLFTSRALAAPTSTSQVPGFIPYQGNLLNQSGDPVNGLIDMTFSLYSVPTGGTALWTEVHTSGNAVPVAGGLFNVNLGSITPIPADLWNQPDLYLGIRVGSDVEMTPRQPLGGIPSALQASVAQLALTVPDGSITKEKLGAGVNNYFIINGAKYVGTYLPDWTLASGSGDRYYVVQINFGETFITPPTVVVNLSGIDVSGNYNVLFAYARNITTTGFELVFQAWGDSVVTSASAAWIVYGQK